LRGRSIGGFPCFSSMHASELEGRKRVRGKEKDGGVMVSSGGQITHGDDDDNDDGF